MKKVIMDQKAEKSGLFIAATLGVFFVIGLITLLRHEMWRDELGCWLMAGQAASLFDLLQNIRYDGHPILWYLQLFTLTRFTSSLLVVKGYHFLLTLIAVFVFLRYAPFPRLQKILFVFGYFFIYEYGVISRIYIQQILLLFLLCRYYPFWRQKPLLYAVLLFLLCQTNVFGVIFALSFFVILSLASIEEHFELENGYRFLAAISIFVSGVVVSVVQMTPPADTGISSWRFYVDFTLVGVVLKSLWASYFPVPQVKLAFWNSNILTLGLLEVIAGLTAFVFVALQFIKKPLILLFYTLCSGAIIAFFYLRYVGYVRHHGQLFLVLVVTLWLAQYCHKTVWFRHRFRFLDRLRVIFPGFLILLLVSHLIAAGIALYCDWQYPFSANKNAARFIRENDLDDLPVAGDSDVATMPIAARLGKALYYPANKEHGTFIKWTDKRMTYRLSDKSWRKKHAKTIIERTQHYAAKKRSDVLLILNYRIPIDHAFVELNAFTTSIVPDERYHLYRIPCKAGEETDTIGG